MTLIESYAKIKPAIVAFCAKHSYNPRYVELGRFPDIIGTGFIIDPCGLILTNQHVVDVFDELPKKNPKEPFDSVCAVLFDSRTTELRYPPLEIVGATKIEVHIPMDDYFDTDPPDIALVGVKLKQLPFCSIRLKPGGIKEGMEVATAGFPMGTLGLMNSTEGAVNQLSPVLQRGIISALQPWSIETPVTFTINVMVQAGASGSPVFDTESGEVLGVLSASRVNPTILNVKPRQHLKSNKNQGTALQTVVQYPTNFSIVVPTYRIANLIQPIKEVMLKQFGDKQVTLEEFYKTRPGIDFIKGKEQ